MPAALVRDTDAVFAVNDIMALGALTGFRERGIAVPDGLALAGYDDIAPLRDVVPALTSVRIPLKDVGAQAVELGLAKRGPRTVVLVLEAAVQLRESTPPRR